VTVTRGILIAAVLAALPGTAGAQAGDLRSRLEARGLPDSLVRTVVAVADGAGARGLPTGAIADKAIEGWAKHVPAPRIAAVLDDFARRLERGREAVRGAGLERPPDGTVVAAADALGRGVSEAQIHQIVNAAHDGSVAAAGISVATALAAQGMELELAIQVVVEAARRGRAMSDILDLPALANALRAQGMSARSVGERLLSDNAFSRGATDAATRAGSGLRPRDIPPDRRPGRDWRPTTRRP
jgi:hypothetical protein